MVLWETVWFYTKRLVNNVFYNFIFCRQIRTENHHKNLHKNLQILHKNLQKCIRSYLCSYGTRTYRKLKSNFCLMFLVLVREIKGKCVLTLALLRVERKRKFEMFQSFQTKCLSTENLTFCTKISFFGKCNCWQSCTLLRLFLSEIISLG